jgi:chromosome partitioning protein
VRTIGLSNNKGGSGKTTTTVSLASSFAERGLRVLVVDLDPQGSTTDWLGRRESPVGLVEYSAGAVRISELVVATTAPGVDLIRTSPSLVPPGEMSRNETGFAIVRAFTRLPDNWDLVLIDTPPTLGYLSLAPLVVSDRIIIPVEAHVLALPGVASVMASIDRARRHVNRRLSVLGIVACRVNATSHAQGVVAQLRSQFGPLVLQHSVRDAIQVAEAPGLRLPITQYAPSSPVTDDYRAVAAELLDRLGDMSSS